MPSEFILTPYALFVMSTLKVKQRSDVQCNEVNFDEEVTDDLVDRGFIFDTVFSERQKGFMYQLTPKGETLMEYIMQTPEPKRQITWVMEGEND